MANRSSFVSVVLVRAMAQGAQREGLDPEALLRQVGLSAGVLDDPDRFVSVDVESKLWNLLSEETTPGFGARAARCLSPGAFRALEYLVRTSKNLELGLSRLARYSGVLHGAQIFALDRAKKGAWFVYESPHDASNPGAHAAAEFALSVVYRFGEEATAWDWDPRPVSFVHKPEDPRALAALFQCPVLWERPRYEIEVAPTLLDAPMHAADSELADVLRRYVERMLEDAPFERPTTAHVRRTIAAILPAEPSLEEVAGRMGVAERSLQEKLLLEQTSYRSELDDLREHLARRQLLRSEMRTAEVAAALGYSESSSFHRAFKRWTSQTPGAYRRSRK